MVCYKKQYWSFIQLGSMIIIGKCMRIVWDRVQILQI